MIRSKMTDGRKEQVVRGRSEKQGCSLISAS